MLKARLTPIDIASLSLGLTMASLGVVVSDMLGAWVGYLQPLVIVVVTVVYGFALRVAYERALNHISRAWLAGLGVLMTVIASAVTTAVLGTLGAHRDYISHFVELALLGAFLGFVVGVLMIPLVLVLGTAARRPLIDVLDRVLVGGAALVTVSALFAILLQHQQDASYGGLVVLGIATAMFIVAGLKIRTRARWLHAVIRGEVPGWSVIDGFSGDEDLPAIGARMKDEAVLATGNTAGGPFRAGGGVSPVARVDRKGGYMQLAYIAFGLAAFTVAVNPFAIWRRGARREHMPFEYVGDKPRHFKIAGPLDDLAVGHETVCVHRPDNSQTCWGSEVGWLTGSKEPTVRTPTRVPSLTGTKVFLGQNRACALVQGVPQCQALYVAPKAGPANVQQVAFGANFRLFLDADGKVTKRTDASHGEELELPPVKMIVSSGFGLACMLTRDGDVYCDGHTSGNQDNGLSKVEGFGDAKVDWIGVRESGAWARTTAADGKHHWYSWNEREARSEDVWDSFHVDDVSLSSYEVCGRRADGSVVCDLDQAPPSQGRMGSMYPDPREVLPVGSALQLEAHSGTTCARGKADVWCWGDL